jgi:hypothetical protein
MKRRRAIGRVGTWSFFIPAVKFFRLFGISTKFLLPAPPTRLEDPTPAQIETARRVCESHRRRFEAGDRRAIAQLLRFNPDFAELPWVKKAIRKDHTLRRVTGPRGGRPVGWSRKTEMLGLRLVHDVRELQRATRKSLDWIFAELADSGRGSRDRLKHLYYETLKYRPLAGPIPIVALTARTARRSRKPS